MKIELNMNMQTFDDLRYVLEQVKELEAEFGKDLVSLIQVNIN